MTVGLNIKSYLEGPYAPVATEQTHVGLTVIGELPADLSGVFLQNSSNPKHAPSGRYHWFDGDGMVHAIQLQGGRATYRNRYVRTRAFEREAEAGGPQWGGLMDGVPDQPPLGQRDKDTGNTDLEWHAGRLLALWWLGGEPYEIGLPDLETRGVATFAQGLPCGVASHTKVDRITGELMFFDYSPYEAPFLHYGVVGADGALSHVSPIDVPGPRLFHDIAITENYTVLLDFPMLWRQDQLARGKRRVWFDDQLPSRIGIVPRHGGNDQVRWFESPPCYAYHTVNAWEEGSEVVITACRIENPLPRVPHEQEPEIPRLYFLRMAPYLHRWRIDLESGAVREEQLCDRLTEFPRIDDRRLGRRNRWTYNMGLAAEPTLLFDAVTKYDLDDGGSVRHAFGAGRFSSEVTFAPRDGGIEEDDGYLVSIVNDIGEGRSEAVVLDARALEAGPVARVQIPSRVPIGFHACWVPGHDLS